MAKRRKFKINKKFEDKFHKYALISSFGNIKVTEYDAPNGFVIFRFDVDKSNERHLDRVKEFMPFASHKALIEYVGRYIDLDGAIVQNETQYSGYSKNYIYFNYKDKVRKVYLYTHLRFTLPSLIDEALKPFIEGHSPDGQYFEGEQI